MQKNDGESAVVERATVATMAVAFFEIWWLFHSPLSFSATLWKLLFLDMSSHLFKRVLP